MLRHNVLYHLNTHNIDYKFQTIKREVDKKVSYHKISIITKDMINEVIAKIKAKIYGIDGKRIGWRNQGTIDNLIEFRDNLK